MPKRDGAQVKCQGERVLRRAKDMGRAKNAREKRDTEN